MKITIKEISIELEKSVDETLKAGRGLGFEVVDENSKVTPKEAILIAETFREKEPKPIEKEIISEDKPKIYKHKKAVSIRLIRKQKK